MLLKQACMFEASQTTCSKVSKKLRQKLASRFSKRNNHITFINKLEEEEYYKLFNNVKFFKCMKNQKEARSNFKNSSFLKDKEIKTKGTYNNIEQNSSFPKYEILNVLNSILPINNNSDTVL